MKRILGFLSIAFLVLPVFASAQVSEDAQIRELQGIIAQLLSLIADLQRQLFFAAVSRAPSLGAVPFSPALPLCSQAEISWERVSGANGYVLFRNGIEVYSGTDVKFIDTGLAPNTTYYYQVRAKNAGGLGPASLAKTITTSPECPPQAPLVWAQAGPCGGTVQVSWTRVQGANFYEVFRGNTRIFGGNGMSVQDRALSVEREYAYKVRAGNSAGFGPFSSEVKVESSSVCPPAAPRTPEAGTPSLQDTLAKEGMLAVSLNASPSGVTVQSGKSAAGILSLRVQAKFSPLTIERLDVDFSDRPWLFLSEVQIREGSIIVSRAEASESAFILIESDERRMSFPGLGIQVPKDGSKTISVAVLAREGLRLVEPRQMSVSIPAKSVRARDQLGIVHAGPETQQAAALAKTFFVKREE